MHLKRWLTGLIALPILLYVLLKGSTLSFMLLLALVSSAAHWEFLIICGLGRTIIEKTMSLALGLLLLLSFSTARPYLPSFFLVFGMLGYFLYYLLQYRIIPPLIAGTGTQLPGIIIRPIPVGPLFVAVATSTRTVLAALVPFGNFCRRYRRFLLGTLVWSKKTLSAG